MTSILKVNNIQSPDTNGDITIDPDGTGDTIIASGNVGIGTSSPSSLLTVAGGFLDVCNNTSTGSLLRVAGSGTASNGVNIEVSKFDGSDGPMKFRTGNAERMRILSGGNILVGQTSTGSPGQGNDVYGVSLTQSGRVFASADGTYSLGLNRSNTGELTNFSRSGDFKGSINISASAVSYNTTSDYRLKQNVVDMTGAITRVKSLAPKRFDFIADAGNTVDGFLAHEAQTVVPEAVTGTHDEVDADGNAVMQGIDQAKLVPLLTGALQEAIAKIEALEARVTALENA